MSCLVNVFSRFGSFDREKSSAVEIDRVAPFPLPFPEVPVKLCATTWKRIDDDGTFVTHGRDKCASDGSPPQRIDENWWQSKDSASHFGQRWRCSFSAPWVRNNRCGKPYRYKHNSSCVIVIARSTLYITSEYRFYRRFFQIYAPCFSRELRLFHRLIFGIVPFVFAGIAP